MSNQAIQKLSNDFQASRLVSLASWRQASEITPKDRNGPYVIIQEAYDPEDAKMRPDEFVLGRSGKWLPVGLFYRLPVPDRRAEFVFGTVAEVMQTFQNLPSKAAILTDKTAPESAEGAPDDMAAVVQAAKASPETK